MVLKIIILSERNQQKMHIVLFHLYKIIENENYIELYSNWKQISDFLGRIRRGWSEELQRARRKF